MDILQSLKISANYLDSLGEYDSANTLNEIMIKVAQVITPSIPLSTKAITPTTDPNIATIKTGILSAINKLNNDNKSLGYQNCANAVYMYLFDQTKAPKLPSVFNDGEFVKNKGLGTDILNSASPALKIINTLAILKPVIPTIQGSTALTTGLTEKHVLQLKGNLQIAGEVIMSGKTKMLKPITSPTSLSIIDSSNIVAGRISGTYNSGNDKFMFNIGQGGTLTSTNKNSPSVKDIHTLIASATPALGINLDSTSLIVVKDVSKVPVSTTPVPLNLKPAIPPRTPTTPHPATINPNGSQQQFNNQQQQQMQGSQPPVYNVNIGNPSFNRPIFRQPYTGRPRFRGH